MRLLTNKALLLLWAVLLTGCVNRAPTANPGGPYNGIVGTPLTFDGTHSTDPDGNTLGLTWNFGDNSPMVVDVAPSHVYSAAGTFTVILLADDHRGGTNSASTTATVAPRPNPGDPSKTTFSKSGNKSWASTGGASVSHTTDSGSTTTRWLFRRLAGFASSTGVIESVEFSGKCLRSPNTSSNAQAVLAACNTADLNQRWTGLRQRTVSNTAFYSFVNEGVQKCLTEGSNSQVTQTDYNGFDNQLWAVRKNSTGQFQGDGTPFLD